MSHSEQAGSESSAEHASTENSAKWVATELHDGLLQWVVSARMHIEAAMAKLQDHPDAAENLAAVNMQLKAAMADARALIGFLDHQQFSQCDVTSAVAEYVESRRYSAELCDQSITLLLPDPKWPELPNAVAWSIVRFVQQAIQNAIQHAGPATITVQLGWKSPGQADSQLELVVCDNGVGFDPSVPVLAGHFGLASLQQRARMAGGTLRIESAPGKGCWIRLMLPANGSH